MNPFVKFACALIFFLTGIFLFEACEKEVSCDGCAVIKENKPPIALAGPDQLVTLPTHSILLDGSSSSDPDGRISSYSWTKISGPDSFAIAHPSDSITNVNSVVPGVYSFELNVTDNEGLSAKDTVQVAVVDPAQPNHPPVANAGADTTIMLPANTRNLNGSSSSDPDNNIVSYTWTKISGPSSFNIANPNASQTQVTYLTEGIYQFELKVTDAGGLFDSDTIQITVQATVPPTQAKCDISNRPLIPAQLIAVGSLSQARGGLAIASIGDKIVFAGGYTTVGPTAMSLVSSTRVDIFDLSTNSWTTAELSEPRYGMASAALGSKIFFAGGYIDGGRTSSRVDIYNTIDNTWSTAELRLSRTEMAVATIENKILFAGGVHAENGFWSGLTVFSNEVDIYDVVHNTWSTATLSRNMRVGMAAISLGNKVYFGGGTGDWAPWDGGPTSSIDIYDGNSNSWSVASLNSARGGLAGIARNNKIYWAGGNYEALNNVEINDIVSSATTSDCLFQPNLYFQAVEKNNTLVFFTGDGVEKNKFDIYNVDTNTWSIGVLPYNVTHHFNSQQIISVNNTIYVAGIDINDNLSNQVWKLEF